MFSLFCNVHHTALFWNLFAFQITAHDVKRRLSHPLSPPVLDGFCVT